VGWYANQTFELLGGQKACAKQRRLPYAGMIQIRSRVFLSRSSSLLGLSDHSEGKNGLRQISRIFEANS
jgi:hypothetical protein